MSRPNLLEFRCDDAAGFQLQVLRAVDGDLHVSVVPHEDDFKREHGEEMREHFAPCHSASVRLRMPMIGGGAHERLWAALASLFKPEAPVLLDAEEARWLAKRNLKWEDAPPLLQWKLDQGKLR